MQIKAFVVALVLVPTVSMAQGVVLDTSELRSGPVSVTSAANAVTVAWSDGSLAGMARDVLAGLRHSPRLRRAPPARQRSSLTRVRFTGGDRQSAWRMERVLRQIRESPEGTRHVRHLPAARREARTLGDRVEPIFEGMRMALRRALSYTFYPGSRLIQQEAVLTNQRSRCASTTTPASTWRACRSPHRQQHAVRDRVLRHLRHIEEGVQQWPASRARTGASPLQNACGEDRRR